MRELLIHFYYLKKSAAKAHRLLRETYGEAALSERSCRKWFQKFKNSEFVIEDKERSGRPKVYEDMELEALLDQDSYQTQEELHGGQSRVELLTARFWVFRALHRELECSENAPNI